MSNVAEGRAAEVEEAVGKFTEELAKTELNARGREVRTSDSHGSEYAIVGEHLSREPVG